jgi:asparagine synthase (glutamine-hydrolysing)
MCGLLGWVFPRGDDAGDRFDRALDLLAHRGPDDRGVFSDRDVLLGGRRLAIQDLSTAGRQPMTDEKSGATIVFNGEIYNYIELREELSREGYQFRSKTDTEVLLKGFLHWGDRVLDKLNGMWAFAIYLPKTQKIFFSRDRFGVKPLYYILHGSKFAFASEPKALLALFPEQRQVDPRTLYEFLAFGLLYSSDGSFYRGISAVAPGHCGEYDLTERRAQFWRYWNYPRQPAGKKDTQAEVEEFAALLDDSVRLRLRSDVPVGISFSGGLDSTAVLASAVQAGASRPVCFTSTYELDDGSEREQAQLASKPYGISPIDVPAPMGQWLTTLERISWHMDGPGYSPAVYPLWMLMQEARRRGIPVILEGQGADEELAGYPQYSALDLRLKIRQILSRPSIALCKDLKESWSSLVEAFTAGTMIRWIARETLPWFVEWNRRRVGALSVLSDEFAASFRRCRESLVQRPLPRTMDEVTARLWEDHSCRILPGLLQYGDAVSMAHGVETRQPFMDYRIVDWLFSRDSTVKLRSGWTKWVLRQYLHRRGRHEIAKRLQKVGYLTPVESWIAGKSSGAIREYLMSTRARIRQYCNPARVDQLLNHHAAGVQGAGNHIYRLVSTEAWLRACGVTA